MLRSSSTAATWTALPAPSGSSGRCTSSPTDPSSWPDQERRRPQHLSAEHAAAGTGGPPQPLRGTESDAPLFLGATGKRLRPSNFGVIWQAARRKAGLEWVRFHDLRHFAATMFASTGASTKEIMSRGGWRSVAMVVRYEHASEERDALLAQALNPYTVGQTVVPIAASADSTRARSAHDDPEVEGEVLELPPLTSGNEAECSGGETRTHNLAVPPGQDPEQHQLE
jgi:hypothetical protein